MSLAPQPFQKKEKEDGEETTQPESKSSQTLHTSLPKPSSLIHTKCQKDTDEEDEELEIDVSSDTESSLKSSDSSGEVFWVLPVPNCNITIY